jgi:hypothetical protein
MHTYTHQLEWTLQDRRQIAQKISDVTEDVIILSLVHIG